VELKSNNKLKIGELPDLKIMSIEEIIFHENPDSEHSSALELFIQKEGKLKNPPVVGYYQGGAHTILLDGANRITALKNLNIRDVLVQKVDLFDSGLLFLHWHHAVEKFPQKDFLDRLLSIEEINVIQSQLKTISLEENDDQLCQIQFSDESIFKVSTKGDLFRKVDLLNKITDLYKGSAYMDRVSYTNLNHLKMNYSQFCALICFKKFTKEELITVVKNGMKLPSGITRIILPKRALRLNVSLDILRFDTPIDEKNHWLNERIQLQVKDKSIRFYHEPTFLFDE